MTKPNPKPQRWNIWRIKNRYLRGVVTLVFLTPLLVTLAACVAFIAICVGIGEGVSYGIHVFRKERDLPRTAKSWWRAVTLKEAA